MLEITIYIIAVGIITAFLQIQNQKTRAVDTRCQGPARGLVAELGTSSRPVLCRSCQGGSAAFSFAFMAENLVRFSRLLSPCLL